MESHIDFKPASPEQVLVIFLKHHRKFTSYKKFVNSAIGSSSSAGTTFPLYSAISVGGPYWQPLNEPFQQLLNKFNLQNASVNLQTILKMR